MYTSSSSSSRLYSGVGLMRSSESSGECFAKFYENWLAEQDARPCRRPLCRRGGGSTGGGEEKDGRQRLQNLVDRVVGHYEYCLPRQGSVGAPRRAPDVLADVDELDGEPLHLGRRVAAQHSHPAALLQVRPPARGPARRHPRALPTPDLASLSPAQLERVDRLHRRTVRREREIAEEEAAVAAEQAVGEMRGVMSGTEEGMERVLERADELRLETIKALVEILEPIQAVHFLTAAGELHHAVRQFGKQKDVGVSRAVANRSEIPI